MNTSLENQIEDFFKRNIISNITNKEEFLNLIKEKKCNFYIGIDPTNDKYHIGHLVPFMIGLRLLKLGAKATILVGGFTGKVGDPSFKNKERPLLDGLVVDKNTEILTNKLKNFFREYSSKVTFVNNDNWLSQMSLKDFLEYSSFFSANKLLKMDHIKQRLDQDLQLSFKEVCYTLLQGIDFHYLNKNNNINVQIGGKDQWINILNGIHLINSFNSEEVSVGITSNLLLTSDGKKMGKTENGAIWGDGSMDVYSFWQYFRNLSDELVKNFLYFFSLEPLEFLDSMLLNKDINDCKIFLANTMVSLVYNKKEDFSENVELIEVKENSLINILLEIGFIKNKSEGKRQIIGGAVKVNSIKILKDYHINNFEEVLEITLGKMKKKRILIIK